MTGVFWSLAMAGLFGFSQLSSRKGLIGMPVDQGTFVMVIISTVLLVVPFLLEDGPRLIRESDGSSLLYFVLAGLIHFVVGFTFMNTSISIIGAARTGSLIATTPLVATFLAAVTLKEAISVPLIVGVIVVILGVRMIASSRPPRPTTQTNPADIGESNRPAGLVAGASVFGLLAALSWGLTPVLIKKGLEGLDSPTVGVTLAMASAGIFYGVILALRGRLQPIFSGLQESPVRWQALAGALVGLGTLCRWIALSYTTAATVTTLSRTSLLVTVGLGSTLLGKDLEPINSRVRWGAVCIVVGVVIVILYGRA